MQAATQVPLRTAVLARIEGYGWGNSRPKLWSVGLSDASTVDTQP